MSFTDEYDEEHEFHPRLQPIVPPQFEEQGFGQEEWDEWRMSEVDLMFCHDADGLGMLEIAEYASPLSTTTTADKYRIPAFLTVLETGHGSLHAWTNPSSLWTTARRKI